MTKKERKVLAESLKQTLQETDHMFTNSTQPHAYIIGYLEGIIKTTIKELED
jgi:hypothetical protein